MTDPSFYFIMAAAGLAGLGMVIAAALAGWRAWLQFKQLELKAGHGSDPTPPTTNTTGARIEIADLKERIRKLEAIAAGVDL